MFRVAACAPELKIADPEFNTGKIIEAINTASDNGCRIVVFPEMAITGYTIGDLIYQDNLLARTGKCLRDIEAHTARTGSIAIVGAPVATLDKLYNTAVVIASGRICGVIPKVYLCNTNQYYEERWFSSEFDRNTDEIAIGGEPVPFGADILFRLEDFPRFIFGAEICEDLWTVIPPSLDMTLAGANVIFNLSASDEYLGKLAYRRDLVRQQSARCLGAYIYAGCGPGESTTDLVYPGHCMIAENSKMLAETERFRFDTQICYADIDLIRLASERIKNNSYAFARQSRNYRMIEVRIEEPEVENCMRYVPPMPFVPPQKAERSEVCREIFSIQTTGLAKRMTHINSHTAVIGVSGGLDSTLALITCVRAFDNMGFDRKNIRAYSMPGFGTTGRTKSNAEKLCEGLGVSFEEIPIMREAQIHLESIAHNPDEYDVVYENAQARIRTLMLMDLANKHKGLVIGTGDLSELALGWCTYGGDQMSMYGVNAGIPKTLVKYIIEYAVEAEFEGEIARTLGDIIETPISPELLPADAEGRIMQETEKTIGPYILHDFFLYYFIRYCFSPRKIFFLAQNAFREKYTDLEIINWMREFYQRFVSQQFKRSAMPDGVKVGTVALSPRGNWRMPSDASAGLWIDEINRISEELSTNQD